MKDSMSLVGDFTGTLVRDDGSVEVVHKHNLVVNSGLLFAIQSIFSTSQTGKMTYIGIGSGSTAVAASQTALVSEIKRLPATISIDTSTATATLTAEFGAGVGTGAITEAAILSASSSGSMFDRVVFAVKNKGANDTYTVKFVVSCTASV